MNKLILTFLTVGLTLLYSNFIGAEPLSMSTNTSAVSLKEVTAEALGMNQDGIGIKKGARVDNFTIKSHLGEMVDFYNLTQKGPVLVVFYRGGWCPYCNLQIRQLTQAWPKFQQKGVTPVLISVDDVDGAALASKTYEIPFPVLSDPDMKAHRAFDVVLEIDEATFKKYLSYGIDLEKWSNRSHHNIAIASVFIVDEKGKVQWAHTSTDYTSRPSTGQILSIVDEWKRGE